MPFSRPARFSPHRISLCLAVFLALAAPCASGAAQGGTANIPAQAAAKTALPPKGFPVTMVPAVAPAQAAKLPVAATWQPLMQRLAKDGVDEGYLRSLFGRLGDSYSHAPMGTKVAELFKRKYLPPPPRKTPAAAPAVYKRFVTPESVAKCKAYLALHEKTFKAMEAAYGVPGEVVAGLLMVETRLGTYLGENSAFWSLACLAAADTPERVDAAVRELPLPMTPDKDEWLKKLLRERSAWAYKELLALVAHGKANGLDPLAMPGSVYGAIGICQFMPSNLPKFAVDGDKDGATDLFDPEDAIPSVGNYLKRHGWEGTEKTARYAALKRYNKSAIYANTILAIAEAIVPPPPAAVKKASPPAPKKTPAMTKSTAKTTKASAAKSARKKPAARPRSKTVKKSDRKASVAK